MNSESTPLRDFSRMLQAFGLRVVVIDSDFAAGEGAETVRLLML